MCNGLLFSIIFTIFLCNWKFVLGRTTSKHKDDKTTGTSVFYDASTSVTANLSSVLFENYDPGVIPNCPGINRINLTIDMAIQQIIEFDEPNQILTLNVWMRLAWRDCQLTWDPSEFEGKNSLVVPYGRAWKPDIVLYERISDEFYGLEDFRHIVYYDGTVKYNFPSTVDILCNIDVTYFPFDTQLCSLKFGSWAYDGFHINVSSRLMAADLSAIMKNVEWIIEKAPAVRHEIYYEYVPEPYPDVTFYIFLRRKPLYYVNNIIVPSVLITCIAVLGFILPADSGEKVGLELTVLLALSVFQLLVADKLPPSSDSTPLIGIYFTFTLFISGAASLIQVLVLNLHHHGDEEMSEWIAFYVLQPLATITLTKVPGFKQFRCITKQKADDNKEEDLLPADPQLWILLAKCVDRIGLVLFLLCFSIGTLVIFTELTWRY